MVLKIQGNKMPSDETEITREELLKLADTFGVTNTELAGLIKNIRNNSKDFEKEIKRLNDQVKKGRAGYADQLALIDRLNDEIEKLGNSTADQAKKSKLLSDRKELVEKAAVKNFQEQRQKFGEELGKAAIAGTGKFVRGLQDGVAATQLTNTVLNAGIDVAAAGLSAAGSAAGGFGGVMMNAKNPIVAGLGVFVSGLGFAGKVAAEAGAALAKFAVEIVSKEIEKTVKAFHDISTGGAVFADGMEGMRDAAKGSMLTLEDFAAVVQRQSANLGASGLSVPAAVKKMGGALSAGGDSMRKNLLNLGVRIEEHGDLVAETMAQMRQSGGPLQASNAEVAAQVENYARNLRTIAAITGEDAKVKEAQSKEITSQLMFQQKLAAMDEKTRTNVIDGMKNLSPVVQKNVRDLVNWGSVLNTGGAVITSMNSGYRDLQINIADQIKQGTLNQDSARAAQKQYNASIRQDIADEHGAFGVIAMTGAVDGLSGIGPEIAQTLGQELKYFAPDADAITTAEGLVKAQMATTNKLTGDMNSAAIAAKSLAISMQEILLPYMKEYAGYSKTILETFKNYLSGLGGEKKFGDTGAKTPTSVLQPAFGSIMREMPRIQDYQTQPGSSTTRGVKEIGKALGGISRGPVSGYSETLHGTEAVVPLADNRSIPVSLDSSSITAAVHQQSGILAEILRAMQNNNSLTSQIVQNSY